MKLELTQKALFLLKLSLSVLIIFFTIRFAVMPGISRYQENILKRQELREIMAEMQDAIDKTPEKTKLAEEKLEELRQASKDYYEIMENREMDGIITGLALKHGLFPVSLTLEQAAPGIADPYRYAPEQTNEEPVSDTYMQIGTARLMLQGDEDKLLAFVDDVESHYPAIKVRSLSVSRNIYLNKELETAFQAEMTCELAIYMYDWESLSQPEIEGT